METNGIPPRPPLPGTQDTPRRSWRARYAELDRRYPWLWGTVFFLLGVIFDIATLGRIDDSFNIIQQGVYLLVLSLLVSLEFAYELRTQPLKPWMQKIWQYREEAIHFMFGSLLSVYTIFYFKSASFIASFVFLALICLLLVVNELPHFRRFGVPMRFALLALCYVSYFGYLVPIGWGGIGALPFFVSVLAAAIFMLGNAYLILRRIPELTLVVRRVIVPSIGVLAGFMLLYVLAWIPPVPLSIQYMGVYHQVERTGDVYRLSHERPFWRFWHNGDQWFYRRPGDKVHVFARIFSPGRFEGNIFVRWSLKDEKRGWQTWDAIPIRIVGGRDQGFRGVAIKENFTEGTWRVQFETEDAREIGRLHFKVYADESTEARSFHVEEQ